MPQSNDKPQQRRSGIGQLTLVEHSLCPLERGRSLVEGLVHKSEYRYSDARRKRRTANARVFAPLGLSANDELYLWGLLALTLAQRDERSDLIATPHWCLKQLGVIDSGSQSGGEDYRLFRDALRRLSTVSYWCDAFYDPVRTEHREVSFHFLSYNLPTDAHSNRAWRLSWDPTFLELVRHGASHLRFDLERYRSLDPASRRLFLFVSKIFHRRATLPQFDLNHLAVDVLGFSKSIDLRDLRMKVVRCLKRLDALGVTRDSQVTRVAKKHYVVNARRGPHFNAIHQSQSQESQPILETLIALGFEIGAAHSLLKRYPARLLEEWADITQAAIERFGNTFFKKSPMAYLVDSVKKAHAGQRTPPDWWHDVRRAEQKQADLSDESRKLFDQLRAELFHDPDKEKQTRPKPSLSSVSDVLKSIR